MKQTILLIAFTLFWKVGMTQNNIIPPQYSYVQVDYDLKDYVSIYIDYTGQIQMGGKKIPIAAVKEELFQQLKYKARLEGLRLPIAIVELVADKRLPFHQLEPLLLELRKLDFLKVHFVCHSKEESRIEGIKTTGFLYRLNSIENSSSIIDEVQDSLQVEWEAFLKAKGKSLKTVEGAVPPPPPPPPPSITAASLRNSTSSLQVKEIKIDNRGFSVDNQQFTLKELKKQLLQWNSQKSTAYILQPSANCPLELFLAPIALNKQVLRELWEKQSKEDFSKGYASLSYLERSMVRNNYPFIMVIEE